MHSSQLTRRSCWPSEDDRIGLAGGLIRRGDAVLDATFANTVVASVGDDVASECWRLIDGRLIAGCTIVAAVKGLRLVLGFAMFFWCRSGNNTTIK